jgi:carbon-monoxide dehydrogenase small subunit
MSIEPLWREGRRLSREEIRHALSGNLCHCTGYQGIIAAVELALDRVQG